jgi:hypothetical protein
MLKLQQPTLRIALITSITILIVLFAILENLRTSQRNTRHQFELHQANLILRIQSIFTPLINNKIPNYAEVRIAKQHLIAAQTSLNFFSQNLNLLHGNGIASAIDKTNTMLSQLHPLIRDISRNYQRQLIEHRAQIIFKNQLITIKKHLTLIKNGGTISQNNKTDLTSIDLLLTISTEALVYENLLNSAQQQDPLFTFEIKNRLIDRINLIIETPVNKNTFKEPRIRTQVRQIQLSLQKTARDNRDFFAKSKSNLTLLQTLQILRDLKQTPEQLQITTLAQSYTLPFYFRPQFHVIHSMLTLLLTLTLGLSSFKSTTSERRPTYMNSTQKEGKRKKMLMNTLGALEDEDRTTQIMPIVPIKNNELDPTVIM